MAGALRVDVGNQALQGLQLLAFTGSEDAIEDAHAGAQPTGEGGADLDKAPVSLPGSYDIATLGCRELRNWALAAAAKSTRATPASRNA